jgi:hypothetical protein
LTGLGYDHPQAESCLKRRWIVANADQFSEYLQQHLALPYRQAREADEQDSTSWLRLGAFSEYSLISIGIEGDYFLKSCPIIFWSFSIEYPTFRLKVLILVLSLKLLRSMLARPSV